MEAILLKIFSLPFLLHMMTGICLSLTPTLFEQEDLLKPAPSLVSPYFLYTLYTIAITCKLVANP